MTGEELYEEYRKAKEKGKSEEFVDSLTNEQLNKLLDHMLQIAQTILERVTLEWQFKSHTEE